MLSMSAEFSACGTRRRVSCVARELCMYSAFLRMVLKREDCKQQAATANWPQRALHDQLPLIARRSLQNTLATVWCMLRASSAPHDLSGSCLMTYLATSRTIVLLASYMRRNTDSLLMAHTSRSPTGRVARGCRVINNQGAALSTAAISSLRSRYVRPMHWPNVCKKFLRRRGFGALQQCQLRRMYRSRTTFTNIDTTAPDDNAS